MHQMRYLWVCGVAVIGALPVFGTSYTTTSFPQWDSSSYISGALSSVVLTTSMTGGPWNTAAGVTYGNYIFTGPDGTNLWSLTVQYFGGYQGLLGAQDGVGGINVTLPGSGKSAVFVWAVAIHNNAVALSDQLNFSYDSTQYGFSGGGFGLTSSRSLTSFVITPNVAGDGVLLEEVDVANSILPQDGGGGDPGPTAAPEGVTIALVGGGLLVLFGSKRKFIRRLAI